ncbi:MAG TPA: DNA-processing protein DprA [Steroidobacteraceae bacterium]|jgi:DNA processing protein|nr:DNA-processing protein DprA [Steroidobacteraceae bacterium]
MTVSPNQLQAWAVIARAPGLFAAELQPALQQVGDATALLRLPAKELCALGLSPAAAAALVAPCVPEVAADLAWLRQSGAWLLSCTDAAFPPQLKEISHAPAVLYGLGKVAALVTPQLAMVGSRNPTAAGRRTAREFAAHFAQAGLTIVSGLARGIDAACHEGALDAGGRTVAVCGTGLDQVYPPDHVQLAARITDCGALVSEFPPATPPLPGNFPRRNRIISGLARGTLVVEAARDSGSLITARYALDQGRNVFAIPGSIHSPLSRGCNQLLKEGAKLVEQASDLLAEVNIPLENIPLIKQTLGGAEVPVGAGRLLDKDYEMLLDALGFEPASIDDLVDRTGLAPQSIASMLLILELEGRLAPQPGALYCRVT